MNHGLNRKIGCLERKAEEEFTRALNVMKSLFEWKLYPILYKVQLSEATRKDDDTFTLEFYLDDLYYKTVNPELTREFWTEVLESIERDDDKLPVSDVVKRWRDANSERDELKEQSYLKVVEAVKRDAEYEAETWRLKQIEQAKQQASQLRLQYKNVSK